MERIVKSIGLAPFAEKHFLTQGKRTAMISAPIQGFLSFVNEGIEKGNVMEVPSSMDFCRYLFIPNFTDARPSHMRIENSNAIWLRSAYEARTERELPVLVRWFDLPIPAPVAEYLMLIVYSKDQLLKEAEHSKEVVPDEPWSVISIMALNTTEVPPMPPITIMRNALGMEEGGNGKALDKQAYAKAVEYWDAHAMVR